MKYVVLVGDGMADYARPELDNKTPLQFARTPNMDMLASRGETGLVKTVPEGYSPGSDVANLSVMGYAPQKYYTGRSPLEAVSMGVDLADYDVAFRCNLVTLSDETEYQNKQMLDYSAGEITSEHAKMLMLAVEEQLGGGNRHFYPGISYRHLMTWSNGPENTELTPPHDISGRRITDYLPRGNGGEALLDLMRRSSLILNNHPVNLERRGKGQRPANSIWLWGQGKKPALPLFKDLYKLKGAVVSAVDLIMGIGLCAGLEVLKVPGATGNIHTNFRGKAESAIEALHQGSDFVYLHVEAPDEAGHQGDTETKVRAIEEIDRQVLGTLLERLAYFKDYKILLLPDHPTPLNLRTHTSEPVPYAIMSNSCSNATGIGYSEETAVSTGIFVPDGPALMGKFLGL